MHSKKYVDAPVVRKFICNKHSGNPYVSAIFVFRLVLPEIMPWLIMFQIHSPC